MTDTNTFKTHWDRGTEDDQTILYRIADLLELLLTEVKSLRKERRDD